LDWAISLGVKRIFSLAAFLTDRPFETPRVYCTVTDALLLEDLKKYGVVPLDEGTISGTNGLILGLAKKKNIEGICLLGENARSPIFHREYILDTKAVRAVLDVLVASLNLRVDMEPLDKQNKAN